MRQRRYSGRAMAWGLAGLTWLVCATTAPAQINAQGGGGFSGGGASGGFAGGVGQSGGAAQQGGSMAFQTGSLTGQMLNQQTATSAYGTTSFMGAYYRNPLAGGLQWAGTTIDSFGQPLFNTAGGAGVGNLAGPGTAGGYGGPTGPNAPLLRGGITGPGVGGTNTFGVGTAGGTGPTGRARPGVGGVGVGGAGGLGLNAGRAGTGLAGAGLGNRAGMGYGNSMAMGQGAGSGLRPATAYYAVPAFEYNGIPATQVRAQAINVIRSSARLSSRNGIDVQVDGEQVVLRGEVANEREKALAEAIVRLSPGVREVRNELKPRTTSTPAP